MNNIIIAQDGPATLTQNGTTYLFPVWKTRDLLPILAKLRDQKVAKLRERMKEFAVPPAQQAYQIWQEESKPLNPYDAHLYFLSADGADECLSHSLKESGVADGLIQGILDKLRFSQKEDLAAYVGGIFEFDRRIPPPNLAKQNEGKALGDATQAVPDQKPGFGDAASPT